MKKSIIIEFESEHGKIYVESEEGIKGQQYVGSSQSGNKIIKKAGVEFSKALDSIGVIAKSLKSSIQEITPDELEIEMGIKLNGEVGAILTKLSTEANLKVTLKWKKDDITHSNTPKPS